MLAVSKQHPVTAIREAAACGQACFGESFIQEATEKIEATQDLALEWHFIGHLQSNKTRTAATHFHWVQSVDRERIAVRLDAQRPHHAPPLNVCIQVSLEDEPGKGGIGEDGLESLARVISALPRLRLRGLMTIPPPSTDPATQRAYFRRLRKMRDDLALGGLVLDTLSMGMSDDLEAAVAEGSTMLRIGTALFGPRARTG